MYGVEGDLSVFDDAKCDDFVRDFVARGASAKANTAERTDAASALCLLGAQK